MLDGLRARLRDLFGRRAGDAELADEMRYHLEREIDRNVAAGMPIEEAQYAAARAFGNVTIATESAREAMRWRVLEELRQDVTYALRTFRRAPAFVAGVIATIGVGLGLLGAVFTFFDAYVLRSQPVREPSSLYEMIWTSRDGSVHPLSAPEYKRFRETQPAFSETLVYAEDLARYQGRVITGQLVSANFFQMLGVAPAFGRVLLPSDNEVPGEGAVVVLSHQAWRTIFGGDSTIVGKRIELHDVTFTVVGIARESFGGLTSLPFDFWVPLAMISRIGPVREFYSASAPEGVYVVGRLKPGITAAGATATLSAWFARETRDRPSKDQSASVELIPRATPVPMTVQTVAVFFPVAIAFVLVLLTACANVANLMLARGMARQREIGIRLALGAPRARVIRQLLTESVLLALPAALAGFLLSRVVLVGAVGLMYSTVPRDYAGFLRVIALDADVVVVLFLFAAAVMAAVAFGLVPALQTTRPNIVQTSRGEFDGHFGRSRLRNALVVTQVTMSVLLLIAAGVFLSGARNTERLDPGIRTHDVVQIDLAAPLPAVALQRLRSDAVVRGIAASTSTPLDGVFQGFVVAADGRPAERAYYSVVTPEYFSLLGLRILAGRAFDDAEAADRAGVVIVSASAARRFWPDRDPIGQTLAVPPQDRAFERLARYRVARVVGVVSDAVPGAMNISPAQAIAYYPRALGTGSGFQLLLVGVGTEVNAGRAHIERLLAGVDSGNVQGMHTLDESLALQVYPFRALNWIATGLGVTALLLTIFGVSGVMAYAVAQRRKEFGIRMALGATASSLVGNVLRQSLRLAVTGVAVGVALALAVSRISAGVMYNIDAFAPAGYFAGIAIVLVACVVAAYGPSTAAARIDPVEALRAD
jgi:predicted permease